jgi:hypothetical protein
MQTCARWRRLMPTRSALAPITTVIGVCFAVPAAIGGEVPHEGRLADFLWRHQSVEWCPGAESNHRHCDFQSHALPTELPGHGNASAGRRVLRPCQGGDQAAFTTYLPRAGDRHPTPPEAPVPDTRRPATVPGPPPDTAACRTAGARGRSAGRRSGISMMHQPFESRLQLLSAIDGSDRSVTARPVRRTISDSATGSA